MHLGIWPETFQLGDSQGCNVYKRVTREKGEKAVIRPEKRESQLEVKNMRLQENESLILFLFK